MIERTLVLIKPDGVQRSLCGKVISRFEDAGLKLVGMKMDWIDKKFAVKHYDNIGKVGKRYGKRILNNLIAYIREGPVIAFVLEGVNAVEIVRKMTGSTYPNEALPGTIRGDFSHISKAYANKKKRKVGNLIHISANKKEAKEEIKLWFSVDELFNYKTVHEKHVF